MAENTEIELTTDAGFDSAADDIAESALPQEDFAGEGEVDSEVGQTTESAAPSPAPAKTGALGDGTAAPAPGSMDPSAPRCPDSLTGEIKELWAKGGIPPAVQQEIIRREEDFHRGYEQAKPHIELGQGFEKMLTPYLETMQRFNVNPVAHTENLLKYHAALMFGQPQQKAEILLGLAHDAGIDIRALAQGTLAVSPNNEMQRELARLKGELSNVNQRFSQADAQQMEKHIEAVAGDTENYPHFWELAPAMIQELNRNPRMDVETAYRAALAASPQMFDTVVAARAQKTAAAATKAAQERAMKARRATSVNIGSSTNARPASRKGGDGEFDLDGALREGLAEIRERN